MAEKKFCVKCGQKLPSEIVNFIAKDKAHEFKEGWYCEKCAKVRVEEARK